MNVSVLISVDVYVRMSVCACVCVCHPKETKSIIHWKVPAYFAHPNHLWPAAGRASSAGVTRALPRALGPALVTIQITLLSISRHPAAPRLSAAARLPLT